MNRPADVPAYRDWPETPRDLYHPFTPLLDVDTPVVSMGSCFAEYIQLFLEKYDFNLLDPHHSYKYSTSSILREIRNAFSDYLTTDEYLCRGGKGYTDLNHHRIYADTPEATLDMINRIERQAKIMLPKGKVFVLTLGQNEVWENVHTGELVLHPYPVSLVKGADLKVHFMTVRQNVDQLQEIHDILTTHIPDVQIILGVCPIALRRTYQDMDAVQGNNLSKYTLYVAANEFAARHDNVHYFAGFDIVEYACAGYDNYQEDGRHLKNEGVDTFLDLFLSSFCTPPMQRTVECLKALEQPDGDEEALFRNLTHLGYPRDLMAVKWAEHFTRKGQYHEAADVLGAIEMVDDSPAVRFHLGLLAGMTGEQEGMQRHLAATLELLGDIRDHAFAGASRDNKIRYGSNHLKMLDNFYSVRTRVLKEMERDARAYLDGAPLPDSLETLPYVAYDVEAM